MVRLAAFDMDGTLLMPDHQLGQETLQTLQRLVDERQITLVFATGRHMLDMRHVLTTNNLHAFLVTGNGARIHNPAGELMYQRDLPLSLAKPILSQHWDTQASMHVFNDTGWFTPRAVPELFEAYRYSGFRPQLADLTTLNPQQVTKITFCGDHHDLCQLRVQLQPRVGDEASLCFSASDCLEILPLGVNKGAALQILTTHLGITMQDCMAFGDAMNDKEMLASVGRGLVMGNAMAQLKTELPHLEVIGNCAHQAVSEYLTTWLDTSKLTYSPE